MHTKLSWFSKLRAQSLIAFSVSSCFHLVLCITFAFILITAQGDVGQSLGLAIESKDDVQEVTELDFAAEALPLSPFVLVDLSYAMTSASPNISFPSSPVISSISHGQANSDVALQAAQAVGAEGSEGGAKLTAQKSKSRASFFGAHAEGNRFVFVIDSSGSMRGPRWEALCKELIRAIQSLSPDQDFFVISFDSMAHPMFGNAPPKGKFLKAIKKNVELVQNWLRSIKHGRRTFPASAVGIAMKLEPDAIFLLSDGEISDSTVEDLRVWNRKKDVEGTVVALVPIHTVLLHSQIGFATLEAIARENGGTFTPVQPR